jgi:hypothetical protein
MSLKAVEVSCCSHQQHLSRRYSPKIEDEFEYDDGNDGDLASILPSDILRCVPIPVSYRAA